MENNNSAIDELIFLENQINSLIETIKYNEEYDELIFLDNHINSLIETIKYNKEYAEIKKEKNKIVVEIQILKRILECIAERKKILATCSGSRINK